MFKNLNVFYISGILFALVFFASCDGRKSSHQALKESIESFRKEASVEIDEYFPEKQFESEIDTILDSGYRINIKINSDFNNEVIITEIKDTINYQKHYRNFIIDLNFHFKDDILISEKFTKQRLNAMVLESNIGLFKFEQQVLSAINIDYDKSNDENIFLELIYRIPETEKISKMALHLKPNGDFKLLGV